VFQDVLLQSEDSLMELSRTINELPLLLINNFKALVPENPRTLFDALRQRMFFLFPPFPLS